MDLMLNNLNIYSYFYFLTLVSQHKKKKKVLFRISSHCVIALEHYQIAPASSSSILDTRILNPEEFIVINYVLILEWYVTYVWGMGDLFLLLYRGPPFWSCTTAEEQFVTETLRFSGLCLLQCSDFHKLRSLMKGCTSFKSMLPRSEICFIFHNDLMRFVS